MPKPVKPTVKTPVFRGSFVNLIKARAMDEDSEPKFSMMIVLPKKAPETVKFLKQLEAAIAEASAAKHGKAIPKEKLKHYPVRDGDSMEGDNFNGMWCIRASSRFRPNVVDTSGTDLDLEEEVYSGAWYKAKISAWGWDNPKSGKGVSLSLESVLKVKDDKKFGGGSKAADDFADDITGEAGGSSDNDDLI